MHNRTKLRKARKELISKLQNRMDPFAVNGMVRLFDLAGELVTLPRETSPGTYQARFENGLEITYTNKARYHDKYRGYSSGRHDGMNPYMQQVLDNWRKLQNNQETIDAFCEGSDLASYAKIMNSCSIAFNGTMRCNWTMVAGTQRSYGPLRSFPEMPDRSICMAITSPVYNVLITKSILRELKKKPVFTKPVVWSSQKNEIDVIDVTLA